MRLPPVALVKHSEKGFGCCSQRLWCHELAVYLVVRKEPDWTVAEFCCAAHLPGDVSPANSSAAESLDSGAVS